MECKNINTLEKAKFTENDAGDVCVRTCGESIPQGLANEGRVTLVAVNDSTWTEVVPSPLGVRRGAAIQNTDGFGNDNPERILINYAPHAPTGAGHGLVIPPGGERFYDVNDQVNFYVRVVAGGGSFNITFEEIA